MPSRRRRSSRRREYPIHSFDDFGQLFNAHGSMSLAQKTKNVRAADNMNIFTKSFKPQLGPGSSTISTIPGYPKDDMANYPVGLIGNTDMSKTWVPPINSNKTQHSQRINSTQTKQKATRSNRKRRRRRSRRSRSRSRRRKRSRSRRRSSRSRRSRRCSYRHRR